MKVLLIEDDSAIVDTIRLAFKLCWPGAELISSFKGKRGIELTENEKPDVVLLDLGLPDLNGFEVIKEIRIFSIVPIMIITVRRDEKDIVKALDLGADEYVIKPFGQMELLARIQALIRRHGNTDLEKTLSIGNIHYSPSMGSLTLNDKTIKLSHTEGLILYELIKFSGHVVTYERLIELIWGGDYTEAMGSIRVYIRHLREKIESDPNSPKVIMNQAGVGYFINKPD